MRRNPRKNLTIWKTTKFHEISCSISTRSQRKCKFHARDRQEREILGSSFANRSAIQRKLTRKRLWTNYWSLTGWRDPREQREEKRYSETRMRCRVKKGKEIKKDTKKFHRCNERFDSFYATWPFCSPLLECLCDLILYNYVFPRLEQILVVASPFWVEK